VGSEADPQDSVAGEKGEQTPEEPPSGRAEDVTPGADPADTGTTDEEGQA
jgi:hypothetical protein